MRVLLLGGYGFIGRAVGETLQRRGHDVIGWGRSAALGRRLLPDATWIEGDLGKMPDASAWSTALAGADAVINASGALQSGGGANLRNSQGRAIVALIDACVQTGVRRFVQISAPGADANADTQFMTTKAIADAHLRGSGLEWIILRPALVIGRNAYGGTALIRALAALPIGITVYGDRPVQCVSLDDVAAACVDAIESGIAAGADLALASREVPTLRDVIVTHRRWLGLPPVRLTFDLPAALAAPIAWAADLAGWLGWRSPLRSTALNVMRHGVLTDEVTGRPLASLAQTLAANPAGLQDRIAARLFMLQPMLVLALAGLWIGSGVVGLIETSRAAAIIGGSAAAALVQACSIIDLLLGGAILVRAWARPAALGMAVVSAAYLIGGSLVTPSLWLDPLAPLLKIVPALVLALIAAAILDRR